MTMPDFGPLAMTDWLGDHLDDPDIKVVDGSWRMPGAVPACEDYQRRHIPGAVFFDIDAVADRTSDLPHMLPPPDDFAEAVGALGISERDKVIVYDDQGVFSAARVWWTFRAMGHANVAVLDGGLPKWRKEDRPITDEPPAPAPVDYKPAFVSEFVCNADHVRAALSGKEIVIADARPADRFYGEAPEPRPGLRSGRMPTAVSVSFNALVCADGTMQPPAKIASIFKAAGITRDTRVITTCGSGVTAAVLSLGLEIIGCGGHSLYDGSWAEWGDERNGDNEFPVVAGRP